MKYIALLALAALSLSSCTEKPAVYPFQFVLLQSVPHTDTDMRRGSFGSTAINPTDETPLSGIAFEGNGNFPLESKWDGNFNQYDPLNSPSDKVRLDMIVTYKEKDYVQNCNVALTANTMTSIKVVFDAADKLRCEMVK